MWHVLRGYKRTLSLRILFGREHFIRWNKPTASVKCHSLHSSVQISSQRFLCFYFHVILNWLPLTHTRLGQNRIFTVSNNIKRSVHSLLRWLRGKRLWIHPHGYRSETEYSMPCLTPTQTPFHCQQFVCVFFYLVSVCLQLWSPQAQRTTVLTSFFQYLFSLLSPCSRSTVQNHIAGGENFGFSSSLSICERIVISKMNWTISPSIEI